MKCKYCGKKLEYHAKNCSACGAPAPRRLFPSRDERLRTLEKVRAERDAARKKRFEELQKRDADIPYSDDKYNTVSGTSFFREFLSRLLVPRYLRTDDYDEHSSRGCIAVFIVFAIIILLLRNCFSCR